MLSFQVEASEALLKGFYSWSRKVPWRGEWQPTPVFLPGESPWAEESGGCSPWGHKELNVTERLTHTHTHTHTSGDLGLSIPMRDSGGKPGES